MINGNTGYFYEYDGADVITFSGDEDGRCVLSGFTITGGNRGIYCAKEASPTITRCVIVGNKAGGIHSEGHPTISHCIVQPGPVADDQG